MSETAKEVDRDENGAIRKREVPIPKFVMQENGSAHLQVYSEEDERRFFGGRTTEFAEAMASHCVNIAGSRDEFSGDKHAALAVVAEVAPRDGIEGMLALQMASVHIAMMRHSRLMASANTIQQLDVHERVFNKLARTYTAQMEALRKHRHGGQQKMTVEHVTVHEGGQAIVGQVSKGGGCID